MSEEVFLARPIEFAASDRDSALGDTDSAADTESVHSTLFEGIWENGRRYHKYRNGHYFVPDDEQEQERLDMQHEICLLTMSHMLYYSPLRSDVRSVLDIGTGTGIWAIDFADQHPSVEVIGTDLSPIQPHWLPPNCRFEIDDYEQPWTFMLGFDFVHGRMLAGSICDVHGLFQQVYNNLAPGGWFELQDFAFPVKSDDNSLKGSALEELNGLVLEGLRILGRNGGLAEQYKQVMIVRGFENVVEIRHQWPQNGWPKDKHHRELGRRNMINTLDGLHGLSARLCTQVLGMSTEELELLLMRCRKDIRNTEIHAYWPIYVVYGQKPRSPYA
ncbi:S-adenosyl-L-methionine-dependent methyltransferase [Aspergillus unguis]